MLFSVWRCETSLPIDWNHMNHFSHLLSFNQQQTYVYYIYLYRYSALFYSGSPALLKHQSRFLAPKQKRRDHRSTKVLKTRKGHETMGIVGVLMEFRPPLVCRHFQPWIKLASLKKKVGPYLGDSWWGKKQLMASNFLEPPLHWGRGGSFQFPWLKAAKNFKISKSGCTKTPGVCGNEHWRKYPKWLLHEPIVLIEKPMAKASKLSFRIYRGLYNYINWSYNL